MPIAKEIAYTLQSRDQKKKKKTSKIYKKMSFDTITPSIEKIKHGGIGNCGSVKSDFY